jgi:hypothetical protein
LECLAGALCPALPSDSQHSNVPSPAQSGSNRYAGGLASVSLPLQVPGVLASVYIALAECTAGSAAALDAIAGALDAVAKALDIDRSHPPSLVIKAEALAAAAKLAASRGSQHVSEAGARWAAARDTYREALRKPKQLGACSERCVVRYNYACALSECGEVAEAVAVLHGVAEKDQGVLVGAAQDGDLTRVLQEPSFVKLAAQYGL